MSAHTDSVESRTETDTRTDDEDENTSTDVMSSHSQQSYRRENRVDATDDVKHRLGLLEDDFVLDNPPETVGGNLDNDETVRACLEDAIRYFHDQLPDEHRQFIKDKWGINDSMIDARGIGFVYGGDAVIDYLLDEAGHHPLTIMQTGLAQASVFKHVFDCWGVSPDNSDMLTERREQIEGVASCSHNVTETLDVLVRAQIQGLIEPRELDLRAIAEHGEEHGLLDLRVWWDKRVTFPYKNEHSEYCYIIGRRTDATDDKVYNNGITDRSESKATTVADTPFRRKVDVSASTLNEYVIIPHFVDVFKNPDDQEHNELAVEIADAIENHIAGDISADALEQYGVEHSPTLADDLDESGTARIHILPDEEHGFVLSPPAIGVQPEDDITFVNHLESDGDFEVRRTPNGMYWEDNSLSNIDSLTCEEAGHQYEYTITIDGVTRRGSVAAYWNVYTNRRNYEIENWLNDEPGFDVDVAKYLKLTVNREWVNTNVINEPIFGVETVHDGKDLVVTEGVTDTIVLHQANIPSISPATTNFKKKHYDAICEVAERAKNVYVVMDNEVNQSGLNGALKTAKILENDGHRALVGELPRPDGVDKIDIAEFMKSNDSKAFMNVLTEAVPPEEHELFDPDEHDPTNTHKANSDVSRDDYGSPDFGSRSTASSSDFDAEGKNVSALYSLSLEDVIDFGVLPKGQANGGSLYRGNNPIEHYGSESGYFVIYEGDNGDLQAHDFKRGYDYTALSWLACDAPCDCDVSESCTCTRSVMNPSGPLSDSETWYVWKYAKEADYIPLLDDDPIPYRAIWYLADKHGLFPSELIPESFDDSLRLPPTVFNRVLDVIEDEYGLDPGRDRLQETES